MNSLHIRPAVGAEDISSILRLEKESFSDAWTEEGIRGTARAAGGFLLVAEQENGAFAGYLIGQEILGEGELLRIAVEPGLRKAGAGSALVQAMLERHPDTLLWRLDVRDGNDAARRLYEKFGFRRLVRHRDFYSDPREDGWLMVYEKEKNPADL